MKPRDGDGGNARSCGKYDSATAVLFPAAGENDISSKMLDDSGCESGGVIPQHDLQRHAHPEKGGEGVQNIICLRDV